MLAYRDLTKEQLEEELLKQKEAYKEICAKNISLDMSRGKPGPDQLDLSMDMLDVFNSKSELKSENGFDCRNYGYALFRDMTDISLLQSSLALK